MPKHFPHFKAYVRLAPSKIHGVGVFAVRPITRGTYVFYGDDSDLIWIKKKSLRRLPFELRRLYDDFCISKGQLLGCPSNFNNLTPAWYLNHSANPNIAVDKTYRFFALRTITKGEELTVDYSTYSDSPVPNGT